MPHLLVVWAGALVGPRGAATLAAIAAALLLPAPARAAGGNRCTDPPPAALPGWARERRATVLVDSVLLSGYRVLRSHRPCWKVTSYGRPALMVGVAERELREHGRRVAPLVIVGLGYNSLWERRRQRHSHWAERFDREAKRLLRTLRRLGARQVVWVTLREPTARTVPPSARGELGRYSWYFPYVNGRLRHLDRRRDDLVLANWKAASDRPGLTYDSIHLNSAGAQLMARTVWRAVSGEARRQGQPMQTGLQPSRP
jgi:hypothetical protein